jgi:hypothetical protein
MIKFKFSRENLIFGKPISIYYSSELDSFPNLDSAEKVRAVLTNVIS